MSDFDMSVGLFKISEAQHPDANIDTTVCELSFFGHTIAWSANGARPLEVLRDELIAKLCAPRDAELAVLRRKLAEAEKERDALTATWQESVACAVRGVGELERQLATAGADCAVMRAFAKAHERWEANLIDSNEAWAPDGMAEFPRLTAPLYDEFMEVQRLRNAALTRPTGQAILDRLKLAEDVADSCGDHVDCVDQYYSREALDAYRAARKANTGANNGKL